MWALVDFTMRLTRGVRSSRAVLAVCAATVATGICIVQRHVHVVLSRPETYTSPLHHRCGLLMLGCAAWAAVEMALPRPIGEELLLALADGGGRSGDRACNDLLQVQIRAETKGYRRRNRVS